MTSKPLLYEDTFTTSRPTSVVVCSESESLFPSSPKSVSDVSTIHLYHNLKSELRGSDYTKCTETFSGEPDQPIYYSSPILWRYCYNDPILIRQHIFCQGECCKQLLVYFAHIQYQRRSQQLARSDMDASDLVSAFSPSVHDTTKHSCSRSPDHRVPWWVMIWIKRSPLAFMVLSVACFFIGLILFVYSSGQVSMYPCLLLV